MWIAQRILLPLLVLVNFSMAKPPLINYSMPGVEQRQRWVASLRSNESPIDWALSYNKYLQVKIRESRARFLYEKFKRIEISFENHFALLESESGFLEWLLKYWFLLVEIAIRNQTSAYSVLLETLYLCTTYFVF